MVHRNAFAGPGAERNLERRTPKSSLFPPRPNQTGLGWTRSQDRTPFAPHTAISEETPFCAGPLPRDGPVEADFCEPGAFGLGRCRALSALQDRKGGQANHPLDGSPSLFAHLSGALRAFQTGASRTRPVPLCRCATFPPRCGGIFPRPRRVYAPASVGALFVRHWRTAPFEKAGETFHVCQSDRTLF